MIGWRPLTDEERETGIIPDDDDELPPEMTPEEWVREHCRNDAPLN